MYTHSETVHKVQTGELWLTYLLYALLVTAPIGILLSIAKSIQYHYQLKHEAQESPEIKELRLLIDHYDWLNRTALLALLLVMAALGTIYYFFGYIFAVAAVLWWIYRVGRGAVSLLDYQSPPMAT